MSDNSKPFGYKEEEIKRFRVLLLRWGKENIKSYPWRYQVDPYCVLISEFMLHRTQTRQVIPIYERFINNLPTLKAFYMARDDAVREVLKPLGLNWRTEGMIAALKQIWEMYQGVPVDYEKLILIHGIGQYIAGAVVCFTLNTPVLLIDSNIVRVTGRVFGLDLKGEARRKKPVITAVARTCDPANPRNFYYAMIDLAHQLCRPRNPLCEKCPLRGVPCHYGMSEFKGQGGTDWLKSIM